MKKNSNDTSPKDLNTLAGGQWTGMSWNESWLVLSDAWHGQLQNQNWNTALGLLS